MGFTLAEIKFCSTVLESEAIQSMVINAGVIHGLDPGAVPGGSTIP